MTLPMQAPATAGPVVLASLMPSGQAYVLDATGQINALALDVGALLGLGFTSANGPGITQLTGDVTAGPGSGVRAATIPNSAVTNAKLANMAANTFKGNATGSPAAPTDMTASQARTNIGLSTACLLDVADQTVSGGANVTSLSLGTKSSGTLTIDCGARPLQYVTNGGAFTFAAPAADGSCAVLVTNNASAGTITFSGFSVGSNTGDALTTTNTQAFSIFVWRINGVAGYRVAAHQ